MRLPNVANTLVVVGLATLGATFLLPSWTAQRVARVEDRAFQVTETLLDVAVLHVPLDLSDPDAVAQSLAAELRRRCAALGQPDGDLPEPILGQPLPTFGNKHYLFRIARQPEPVRRPDDWDPLRRRPLEVYGWPRTLLPPGRTVFMAPELGAIAYTRNLGAEYAGLGENPPRGGSGVPRGDSTEAESRGAYRAAVPGSAKDERWIVLHPDRPPHRR